MVGGEGAGPEIRPAFLQAGSERLQEKLQWTAPAAGVLPVRRPPLPGTHTDDRWMLKPQISEIRTQNSINSRLKGRLISAEVYL